MSSFSSALPHSSLLSISPTSASSSFSPSLKLSIYLFHPFRLLLLLLLLSHFSNLPISLSSSLIFLTHVPLSLSLLSPPTHTHTHPSSPLLEGGREGGISGGNQSFPPLFPPPEESIVVNLHRLPQLMFQTSSPNSLPELGWEEAAGKADDMGRGFFSLPHLPSLLEAVADKDLRRQTPHNGGTPAPPSSDHHFVRKVLVINVF